MYPFFQILVIRGKCPAVHREQGDGIAAGPVMLQLDLQGLAHRIDDADKGTGQMLLNADVRIDGHVHNDWQVVGLLVKRDSNVVWNRGVGGRENRSIEPHTILTQRMIRTLDDVDAVAAIVDVGRHQNDVKAVVQTAGGETVGVLRVRGLRVQRGELRV